MKNIDLNTLHGKIQGLKEKKLPIRMALILNRNAKIINSAFEDVEEQRMNALRKYAEKDENGEIIVDESGNAKIKNTEDLIAELDELYSTELDLQFEKISEADLEKCEDEKYDSLTVEEIDILSFMIGE